MAEDAPLFTITSQMPDFGMDEHGQATKGYEIKFVTRSGARGLVFVPMSEYSAETAGARVREMARHLEAVHALTS